MVVRLHIGVRGPGVRVSQVRHQGWKGWEMVYLHRVGVAEREAGPL